MTLLYIMLWSQFFVRDRSNYEVAYVTAFVSVFAHRLLVSVKHGLLWPSIDDRMNTSYWPKHQLSGLDIISAWGPLESHTVQRWLNVSALRLGINLEESELLISKKLQSGCTSMKPKKLLTVAKDIVTKLVVGSQRFKPFHPVLFTISFLIAIAPVFVRFLSGRSVGPGGDTSFPRLLQISIAAFLMLEFNYYIRYG
jgi:hypothetical protein